jgi:hypothetical protein
MSRPFSWNCPEEEEAKSSPLCPLISLEIMLTALSPLSFAPSPDLSGVDNSKFVLIKSFAAETHLAAAIKTLTKLIRRISCERNS